MTSGLISLIHHFKGMKLSLKVLLEVGGGIISRNHEDLKCYFNRSYQFIYRGQFFLKQNIFSGGVPGRRPSGAPAVRERHSGGKGTAEYSEYPL